MAIRGVVDVDNVKELGGGSDPERVILLEPISIIYLASLPSFSFVYKVSPNPPPFSSLSSLNNLPLMMKRNSVKWNAVVKMEEPTPKLSSPHDKLPELSLAVFPEQIGSGRANILNINCCKNLRRFFVA